MSATTRAFARAVWRSSPLSPEHERAKEWYRWMIRKGIPISVFVPCYDFTCEHYMQLTVSCAHAGDRERRARRMLRENGIRVSA